MRWYMVNRIGMATLCNNEAEARREASYADEQWPNFAPHVARAWPNDDKDRIEPTDRQHTERARRAAAVLAKRGWSVTDNLGSCCHRCGYDSLRDARYCFHCGESVRDFTRDTLDDLEAAIAAAVDGVA